MFPGSYREEAPAEALVAAVYSLPAKCGVQLQIHKPRRAPIEETVACNPNYPFPRVSPAMREYVCRRTRLPPQRRGEGNNEGNQSDFAAVERLLSAQGAGSAMRFVLTYSGQLPPNGGPAAKHRVRQALLPQLKQ